jgi:hypothetical protein
MDDPVTASSKNCQNPSSSATVVRTLSPESR